jgi:hypothetical protein
VSRCGENIKDGELVELVAIVSWLATEDIVELGKSILISSPGLGNDTESLPERECLFGN